MSVYLQEAVLSGRTEINDEGEAGWKRVQSMTYI